MREPPRWKKNPNAYMSPWGFVTFKHRKFMNWIHEILHPNLTKPWTFKKYFHVLGVYHRCMQGFNSNHKLMRGRGDASAFGYQQWQDDLKAKAVTRIDDPTKKEVT